MCATCGVGAEPGHNPTFWNGEWGHNMECLPHFLRLYIYYRCVSGLSIHFCHHQSLLFFFSTLDFTIDTLSGLISRAPGRAVFLLLIGFVLVFSSRLSAVN